MKKMNYVEKSLNGKAELVTGGHFEQTKMQYAAWAALAIVAMPLAIAHSWEATGILTVTSAVHYARVFLERYSTEHAVTTARLIKKTGLVARKGEELRLCEVQSVQVHQGIIGRLLDYGDVIATGTGGQTVALHGVVDPMMVKRKVEA